MRFQAISGIDGGSLDGGPDQAGGMFVSPTDFGGRLLDWVREADPAEEQPF